MRDRIAALACGISITALLGITGGLEAGTIGWIPGVIGIAVSMIAAWISADYMELESDREYHSRRWRPADMDPDLEELKSPPSGRTL